MSTRFYLLISIFFTLHTQALVYEYTYFGQPLQFDEATSLEWGWRQSYSSSAAPSHYQGTMQIDESLIPGGTLVNTSVYFFAEEAFWPEYSVNTPLGLLDDSSQVSGLLSFDIHPFPGGVWSWIHFTTDEKRNIVSWKSDYTDHYPDGGIRDDGDWWGAYSGEFYRAEPGTWSKPRVVPIPSTLILSSSLALIFMGLRINKKLKW